jgi:hypothetical protein
MTSEWFRLAAEPLIQERREQERLQELFDSSYNQGVAWGQLGILGRFDDKAIAAMGLLPSVVRSGAMDWTDFTKSVYFTFKQYREFQANERNWKRFWENAEEHPFRASAKFAGQFVVEQLELVAPAVMGEEAVVARGVKAAGGVARTAGDIARLGGTVVDVSKLSVNAAAQSRVFLGHFGGEGIIVGGQQIAVPNAGLQALEGLARQHGGRTLAGMPGDIEALASAIRNADEIIFNVGANGIRANSLTFQELDLIIKERMLGKVTFVTGVTY